MKSSHFNTIWHLLTLVLIAILIQGCTTKLTATKVTETSTEIKGQVYYLPKTSYQVELDRELKSCSMEYDSEMVAAQEWLRGQADILGSFLDRDIKKIQKKYKELFKKAEIAPGQEGNFDGCNLGYLHEYLKDNQQSQDGQTLKEEYDKSISKDERVLIKEKLDIATVEYNKIINDDVLNKPFINQYLSTFLPTGWKEQYTPSVCSIAGFKKFFETEEKVPNKAEVQLKLNVGMKAQISQTALSDPDHIYSIQYDGMSQGIKNTDFSVETYPNGTLKSVNVTLKDQSGKLIESVIQGAVKISSAASGIPLGLVQQSGAGSSTVPFKDWLEATRQGGSLCSAKTMLKIKQRDLLAKVNDSLAKKNLKKLKEITKQEELVSELEKELTAKKKKLESMDESDSEYPVLAQKVEDNKKVIKAGKESLDEMAKDQKQIAKNSSEASESLNKVRKSLTITVATDFVPKPAKLELDEQNKKKITENAKISSTMYGADSALRAWFDTEKVKKYCTDSTLCTNELPKIALAASYAEVTLHPSLKAVGSLPQPEAGSLVYRQPIKSPIWVCKESSCFPNPNSQEMVGQEDILLSSAVDVPQLGVLASLPLVNWPFQNNTLVASFSETGALTKLSYKTNAAAVSAAETFSKSADTYLQYREARLKEPEEKLDRATGKVEANTKLLKAQLEERKAQTALDDELDQ